LRSFEKLKISSIERRGGERVGELLLQGTIDLVTAAAVSVLGVLEEPKDKRMPKLLNKAAENTIYHHMQEQEAITTTATTCEPKPRATTTTTKLD